MTAAPNPTAGTEREVHDLVGVGLGPFNLALAALADGVPGLSARFLEARPDFSWHPGLLLEGARLQVPFLADLVTLVDPTSRWSFLSYLREHDRLFPFYFSENFHVPRREYDDYCRWVATGLDSCRFDARVLTVHHDEGVFTVEHEDASGARRTVRGRALVLGIGTEPVLPEALRDLAGDRVFHAAEYLDRVGGLAGARDLTVIGSGQSGAEVFLDLLRSPAHADTRVNWLTRSPGFAPMEYSKLGLEHFTPDYTRYFHSLPQPTRDRLVPSQWQLYKGISADTISEIHDALYERGVGGAPVDVSLRAHCELLEAREDGGRIALTFRHREQDRVFTARTDGVVAASGYAQRRPDFLEPVLKLIETDDRGRFAIDADHRLRTDPALTAPIHVQNAELHTHGVGAPDLGLGAWRAATILNSLTGRTVYRLPERTAYTSFGAPDASGGGE
ncbi:lysine N(6)-hydroxylase/L-ornithine N(5)-oxygenase family protein [Nocardiopsis sp. EMB25]|uniref:lysine N(6)-hydroxylase/L-ornithine N(5)-oxygenase family protein n=1 Tax=Nocardiopsis sp. EMB25 TaxID=2835867 RepID=UPI002283B34E|nr:lysine N(6)-hydroxylase/L-ornithine N(5)-oxygenase family protein [Nocardiopsis sp. EMB25]MCY9784096.1 lysine N(6)-hydroxylase/L-ornithine N(5)-oxygenase family protein [Nocardiopsis sp. EMB25]